MYVKNTQTAPTNLRELREERLAQFLDVGQVLAVLGPKVDSTACPILNVSTNLAGIE